jgi:hypothetical protein
MPKFPLKALSVSLVATLVAMADSTFAQNKSAPPQCRAQAKEAAKIAYDQCMVVAKENEAENIRKEYKVKLAKLKEHYEQKLKKLNLKAKSDAKTAANASTTEAPRALPQKAITPAIRDESVLSRQDGASGTYSTPEPTNIREAAPIENSMMNEDQPTNSNEPVIRLKEAPAVEPRNELETPPEMAI